MNALSEFRRISSANRQRALALGFALGGLVLAAVAYRGTFDDPARDRNVVAHYAQPVTPSVRRGKATSDYLRVFRAREDVGFAVRDGVAIQ